MTPPTTPSGRTTAEARNVISGNDRAGVAIIGGTGGVGDPTGNLVQGNFIGTDVTGQFDLGNGGPGVGLTIGASENTIGGVSVGSGNVIAFNDGDGVLLETTIRPTHGNAILSNSIFSNTELGIDLSPGANSDQNFPVLSSAISQSGTTTIEGTLDGQPGTTFRLEFFSNNACDPSGRGEGKFFLGSANVTTDGEGEVGFAKSFDVDLPEGRWVTATATDPGGNTSEFSQCVTGPDTTPPSIDAPDGITVEGHITGGADKNNVAITAFLEAFAVTDAVDPSPVITNDVPEALPLGDTLVTFTATDASGNQATGQATITVVDTTPPLVTLPESITVEAEGSGGVDKRNAAIEAFLNAAEATDAVDPNLTIVIDAPDLLPLGDTAVTFTVTDANGNQATGQATITVVDTIPPRVTVPESITVEGEISGGVSKGNAAIRAFLNAVEATDIGDPNLMITNDAPDVLALGDTVVTFTATDASGNESKGQATITVVDTELPLISVPVGITVDGDVIDGADRGNAAIEALLNAVEATDAVDPNLEVVIDTPDLLPLGDTVITITATDASGNQATGQAIITVVDTTPPVVTIPDSFIVEGEVSGGADKGNAAVEAFLNAAEATDLVDPDPTIVNNIPDILPLGDTEVTFTASDASGNQATGQATITVVDTTPPLITLPNNVTVEGEVSGGVAKGNAAVEAFLNASEATGLVDSDPTIVNDVPDVLPVGGTVVIFTATDASGNEATGQATITVVDVTPTPTPTSAPTPTSTPRPRQLLVLR